MPEISRFFGIIITMYWNDHNPHAGRGLQPRPKRLMLPLSLKKRLPT